MADRGNIMKFIHLADVHLGAEPESGTTLGSIRKTEIWESFRAVIELCETEQVDLLLIPGDLFHGQPLLREVKEVDYLFRKLTKTRVVMIAGNHDCLLDSSHYYDITFPEHVTFLMDAAADSVFLPELNTEVFGLSYEVRQIPEARYDEIHIHDAERINILLAHGNVQGNDKSIPIHCNALETAGFDYVALGHIHNRFEISKRIAYSGSLEPLNRGETGQKGYIIGTITKNKTERSEIQWKFVASAKRQYIPLEVVVDSGSTEFSVCEDMLKVMREQGMHHMYLITLTGKRSRELVWNRENMLAAVRSGGGILLELWDKTVPDFSMTRLEEEQRDTLVGRFIRRMELVEDEKIRGMALQYGLQALLCRDDRT